MLYCVGKNHPWQIHVIGGKWYCGCPNGSPKKRGDRCDHLHDVWDAADLGFYSDLFDWTPAGLAAGQRCRCRGEEIRLVHPPPKEHPIAPEAGTPPRNKPCPCDQITGRDGIGHSIFAKCGGTPERPHKIGVWPLEWLTPPGVTPPTPPVPPKPPIGGPGLPPVPPVPPGVPDKEQRRRLRVEQEILRAEALAEHNVFIDAVLDKWRTWDALRKARGAKVRDEALIQELLRQVDEWAERARKLRPPPKPKKGKK